ncbi:MAG: hypothetical protein ACP5HS_14070 [Anaerolineae bacterium]
MNADPVLSAEAIVEVSLDQARAWFLSLADHPERYQFETHGGFTFTEGRFGEPGARFRTEERFLGIPVPLRFELTKVERRRFTFHLRKPLSSIWGYFELAPMPSGATELRLAIGSDKRAKRLFLKLPPVSHAVRRQIEAEVANIKGSMESLYKEETWAS